MNSATATFEEKANFPFAEGWSPSCETELCAWSDIPLKIRPKECWPWMYIFTLF